MAMRQFVVFLSLVNLVASVTPQNEQGIMRREMSLDSTGTVQLEKKTEASVAGDLCDTLFVQLGQGQKCESPNHEIPDSFICSVAAGREETPPNFVLHNEWFDYHPPACYKDTVDGKYYFNPTGRNSTKSDLSKGGANDAPICMTKLFAMAVAAEDGKPKTCDGISGGNYKPITNETTCRFAASCRSACQENQFQVPEGEARDQRPPGCFIRDSGTDHAWLDYCYEFNPNEDVQPENIVEGTPICEHVEDELDQAADSLAALTGKVVVSQSLDDAGQSNPCSSLGCNSHKCEWVSGGCISRVSAGKSCSNAVVKGLGEDAAAVKGGTSVKISTLKDCVDVVRKEQGGSCSGHFQLHKETMTCSCVPLGDNCAEQEDQQVCRFVVKD